MQEPIPLWPVPKMFQAKPQVFNVPEFTRIAIPSTFQPQFEASKLADKWANYCSGTLELSTQPSAAEITATIDSNWPGSTQGYRLNLKPDQITLTAGCETGLFYACLTLQQLICNQANRTHKTLVSLNCVDIEDWPDYLHRGISFDISRTKVPTMETLYQWVDQAAALKLNQVQLYMEHSFAYQGHEKVWQDASPMLAEQIQALDVYCKHRCIQLVPNQNSFGHFHQWLKHEDYKHLAECPQGITHPFSLDLEPFSICPTEPQALALLEDLYNQLLPNFSTQQFNVGLDETFDLGQGRSAELCEQKGKTQVYLEFLNWVHQTIKKRGFRMQFWGDILIQQPELLHQVPHDAIALEWGYEADHPFQKHCQSYAHSQREFFVCPGTSSWSSMVGRLENALENLAQAAKFGHEYGATGYLITDWGDYGHLQPPAISWPAYVAGAGWSWNIASVNSQTPAQLKTITANVFLKTPTSEICDAIWEMGQAYRDCDIQPSNGSSLFFLLLYADKDMTHDRLKGLTPTGLQKSMDRLETAKKHLKDASIVDQETTKVITELEWAIGLAMFACHLGTHWAATPPGTLLSALPKAIRLELSQELNTLIDQFPSIRAMRFRHGGLSASIRYLNRVKDLLDRADT